MSELLGRASQLRHAAAVGNGANEKAVREQRQLHERRVGEFIGLLTTADIPKVSLYTERYRPGDPALGDRRGGRQFEYRNVQTGYVELGQGWVVREYDHNGGDILDGVFVLDNGLYTRSLTKVETAPRGNLSNVPEVPFYTTSPYAVVPEGARPPSAAELLAQGADFARPEGADLLAQALMRYNIA